MTNEARRARGLGVAAVLTLLAVGGAGSSRAAAAPADLRSPTTVSAAEVLSRITASDGLLESYAVPIHIEARMHRLFTFRFGFNGMVYYKRPDRVALEMRMVPNDYRRLFAELGTPLTWSSTYDVNVVSENVVDGHTTYQLKGTPKRESAVEYVLFDVDADPSDPLRARWFCRDGSRIDERLTEANAGVFELPKHAEADIAFGNYDVHATIDYGNYDLNETLADSVFSNG